MRRCMNSGKGTGVNISSVIRLFTGVFFLTTLPANVYALTPDQVLDKVKDSVVVVMTLDPQGKMKGFGSGVLISAGRVATNCRVVEGGVSYMAGRGKMLVRATLYAEDGDKDICLLDVKRLTGKPAQIGKAADLKVGVPVYAVGAQQGLELSLSDGIVSQLQGGPPPFIQTTAAISPGSSGGGLFDGEGRLVGLTAIYMEGGLTLNFAMPAEWIGEVKPGRKPAVEGRGHTEWLKHAIALQKLNDRQGLLDWCLKWVKSDPKNASAWENLGFAYAVLERYDNAIEAYRQSLRINPKNASAWFCLGVAYDGLKSYDEAVSAYLQSTQIDPDDDFTWYCLGLDYTVLKRYDKAIEAFRQSIRIDPKHALAWYKLGFAYNKLNRYDDAIGAYRQALRINPKDAVGWESLGENYHLSGNRSAALEAARELRRLDPARADRLFNLIEPR